MDALKRIASTTDLNNNNSMNVWFYVYENTEPIHISKSVVYATDTTTYTFYRQTTSPTYAVGVAVFVVFIVIFDRIQTV